MNDQRLSELIGAARSRPWSGPDHSPRVDAMLSKERTVSHKKNRTPVIAVLAAATLGGGALAAVVTHQVMTRRAVLVTDDGTEYQVELLESPDGATGRFVADTGEIFHIHAMDEDAMQEVSVTMEAEKDAGATVMIDGAEAAGPTGAAFIDENGNKRQIDPSLVPGWNESKDDGVVVIGEDGQPYEIDPDAVPHRDD